MTTKNIATTEAAPERAGPPAISPKSVKRVGGNQSWLEWEVILPKGFEPADLQETICWQKVQQDRSTVMARHHRVYCRAHDDSWSSVHIVTGATGDAVSLSKPLGGVVSMESRAGTQRSDGTYREEWRSGGYVWVRISDGQPVSNPVANQTLSDRELANLYPRSAVA